MVFFHFYTVLLTHVILCEYIFPFYIQCCDTDFLLRFMHCGCNVLMLGHLRLGVCLLHRNTPSPSGCCRRGQKNPDGAGTSYCSDTFGNVHRAITAQKPPLNRTRLDDLKSSDCAQLNTQFWKNLRPPSDPSWHCLYLSSSPTPRTLKSTGVGYEMKL